MVKAGAVLNLKDLKEPTVVILQSKTQPDGVVHQVTLDPAKVRGPFVRLGDTKGDELNGWVFPANLYIHVVLGDGNG